MAIGNFVLNKSNTFIAKEQVEIYHGRLGRGVRVEKNLTKTHQQRRGVKVFKNALRY